MCGRGSQSRPGPARQKINFKSFSKTRGEKEGNEGKSGAEKLKGSRKIVIRASWRVSILTVK